MIGLDRMPKWAVFGCCLALLAVVAAGDGATRSFDFSSFYLLPIMAATWYVGRGAGVFFCLACGATEFLARQLSGGDSDALQPLWHELMSMAFFLVTVFVLAALRDSMAREKHLARTDSLTGTANLRHLLERTQLERERAARSGRPLTMVYVDLDDFKRVNDEQGHAAGDRLLYVFAGAVQKETRATDLLGRIGGDEFCLLMPETDAEQARAVMFRLQERLTEVFKAEGSSVSMSTGVVTFVKVPESVDDMLGAADAAMYQVKKAGKDAIRFVSYPSRPKASARA